MVWARRSTALCWDMCGRARLSSDVSEIKLVFGIPPERPTPNIAPSWNMAPTDPLPVVRYDAKDHQREARCDAPRWQVCYKQLHIRHKNLPIRHFLGFWGATLFLLKHKI